MTSSSQVWPYYTPWTLADVKTAAWLVEKGHLTQLERFISSSDLDTSFVSEELVSIRRVAFKTLQVQDTCVDNPYFANCKLIVKARYCGNKYYAKFCCRSCTLAGQLSYN